MKNLLRLIIDAAKNDDMNRVIELAENQQDKFCGNNCVWTDHHPECVRAEPEWYYVIDVHGCNRFYHRTEDCPYKVKTPVYTKPQQCTWVELTDRQKLVLIKHAQDWTALQLIEEVETMLRINNA